jgi:hypothetical protein
LTTTGPNGNWAGESTWNQGNGVGSGGGISTTYSIPSWQQGVDMTTNLGSTTYRNIPDVAMVAYNVQAVYNNGATSGFMGTSCAAPLWAGFMALVNQWAASNAKPSAGFINAAIYAIGTGTNYSTMFHDITTGNNASSRSPNRFYATPGYDLCTGWGTPSGSNLISALATPEALNIMPLHDFISGGPVGGPFSLVSQAYMLTNFGSVPLNWVLSAPSNWLNLSMTNGVLNPGSSGTITGTLNAMTETLPAGNYTNIEYFTNRTDNSVQARRFILQVWPSLVQNGGFESGDFSGWTESGNFSSCFIATGTNYARSGKYGAQIGPDGSLGYLSQIITTSPGQPYLISLWLDSPDGKNPNEFVVNWNGTNLFDEVNLKKFGWTNLQFLVTGTATNAILEFGFADNVSFLGLDDISVAPVPAPLIQDVFLAGGHFVFSWNALNGIRYQIQYETNLLQTNWLNLGNTVTATNSTVVGTDAIGSASQRFYRLLLLP